MELLSLNGPEETTPQTLEETLEMGLLKVQGKLFKQGASLLNQAMQMDPQKVQRLLSVKFQKSLQAKEWEIAMTLGTSLLKANPSNPDLANQLGNCARRLDNYSLANNYYRHALKIQKDHALARFNLGASLAKCDKYDQDVRMALNPLLEHSELILPRYKRSSNFAEEITKEVAQSLGREPEYDEILKYQETKAKELNIEEREELYFNLALLGLTQGDPLAAKPLKSLMERQSELPNLTLLQHLITEMAHLKDDHDLMHDLQDLVEHERENRLALLNLGILYKKTGNWLKAYKFLLQAHELLEQTEGRYEIEEQLSLADHLFQTEAFDRAILIYQAVLTQANNNHARRMLGQIYLLQERWEEAVGILKPLTALRKNKPAQETLAEAYEQLKGIGEKARENNKSVEALRFLEYASELVQEPSLFKALEQLCSHLKYKDKVEKYQQAYQDALTEQEERLKEEKRDELLDHGRELVRDKKFVQAIMTLQQAWKIKPNRDSFMLLAYLYKNMKKQEELQQLLNSWKRFQEEQT